MPSRLSRQELTCANANNIVLSGCARTISADLEATDHYKCLDYGAQLGSDVYVQCRAQLASAHETARNSPVAPTCDTQPSGQVVCN